MNEHPLIPLPAKMRYKSLRIAVCSAILLRVHNILEVPRCTKSEQ